MARVIRIISDYKLPYMSALRFVDLSGVLEHPEYLGHHFNQNGWFLWGLDKCEMVSVFLPSCLSGPRV